MSDFRSQETTEWKVGIIYQTLIRLLKKFFIMWDKWTPGDFDARSAAIKSLPCLLSAMKLKLERSTNSKSNWTLPFLQGKK